jgi:hypothetical protein
LTGNSGAANASADIQIPTYYATANDPWYYTGNSCDYETPGVRAYFHCSNNAAFGGSTSDQYISCWDQAQGLIFESYASNKGAGASLGNSTCPGTGPSSCAKQIPGVSGCSIERSAVDADRQIGTFSALGYTIGKNLSSIGTASLAAVLRLNELSVGDIRHALQLNVPCIGTTAFPFPGISPNSYCNPASANAPVPGMLFFLDYTPAEILAMNIPTWQKGILTAWSKYGAYIDQTGGAGFSIASGGLEAPDAYFYYEGSTASPLASLCAQSGFSCANSGASRNAIAYMFANIPAVSGPNCPSSTCTVDRHIHLADQCVAKALAGAVGGCP